MSVNTVKTDVTVFIINVIMCLMSHLTNNFSDNVKKKSYNVCRDLQVEAQRDEPVFAHLSFCFEEI